MEVVHVESDVESVTCLMIDEPGKELPKQSVEQQLQIASDSTCSTPLAMWEPTPMDVQGEEQEMEMDTMLEVNVPTPSSEGPIK